MSDIPTVIFNATHQTETNRLLHILVNVANGFYYRRNFAVLPYLVRENAAVAYLPQFPYHKIPSGWQKWATIDDTDVPLNYPTEWVSELETIFPDNTNTLQNRCTQLTTDWGVSFPKVWEYLTTIFPNITHTLSTVEIRVTSYGTKMSYESLSEKPAQKWTCYIREDMPLSVIYEGLIQGILHHQQYHHTMTWEGRETIADFLISQLQTLGYIQGFQPTMNALLTLSPALLTQSHQYLQQLGQPYTNPFTHQNNIIYYHRQPISQHLTPTQNIIFQRLISKNQGCISYDELSSILWSQPETFSMWAINKTMSRLKKKLNDLQINAHIENQKGQGYYLTYQSGIK